MRAKARALTSGSSEAFASGVVDDPESAGGAPFTGSLVPDKPKPEVDRLDVPFPFVSEVFFGSPKFWRDGGLELKGVDKYKGLSISPSAPIDEDDPFLKSPRRGVGGGWAAVVGVDGSDIGCCLASGGGSVGVGGTLGTLTLKKDEVLVLVFIFGRAGGVVPEVDVRRCLKPDDSRGLGEGSALLPADGAKDREGGKEDGAGFVGAGEGAALNPLLC